jgi:HAD superfamily hydrolase (TIGR01509 family)
MAIKAIIFDCFGVLCVGSLDLLYEMAGDRWQEVQDISRAADHGIISRDEFLARVAPVVAMTPEELRHFVDKAHVKDERMLAYVKEVRKQYKTALLSNISDSAIEALFPPEEQRELFDAVVTSSSVGCCKPAPQIYEHTALQLSVLPEECLMVDDMETNVSGAQVVGMKGVVFTGVHEGTERIKEVLYA